jgi:hypothetical protein
MTMVWVREKDNFGERRGGDIAIPTHVQTFGAVSTRDTFQSFRSLDTDTAVTIQWHGLPLGIRVDHKSELSNIVATILSLRMR